MDRLTFTGLQKISLNRQAVPRIQVPIGPKSGMRRVPGVCRFLAIRRGEISGAKKAAKGAICPRLANFSSVPYQAAPGLLRPAAHGRQATLRVYRALRDDVDDAV